MSARYIAWCLRNKVKAKSENPDMISQVFFSNIPRMERGHIFMQFAEMLVTSKVRDTAVEVVHEQTLRKMLLLRLKFVLATIFYDPIFAAHSQEIKKVFLEKTETDFAALRDSREMQEILQQDLYFFIGFDRLIFKEFRRGLHVHAYTVSGDFMAAPAA